MTSYKSYYTDDYQRNAADWPRLVNRPLIDEEGKWKFGGPWKAEGEISDALKLSMSDAPDDLVKACLSRAKRVLEEIDKIDLMNTDKKHAQSTHSKIYYLISKAVLDLLGDRSPSLDVWSELGNLRLQLFESLGMSAPDENLYAVLYFLLARQYAKAKEVAHSMRSAPFYTMEFRALKSLSADLAETGAPVKSQKVREEVLDYFEQMRNPQPENIPGKPYKKFDKSILATFEWALLIGEVIEPGDGRLDAKRAIDMVSR